MTFDAQLVQLKNSLHPEEVLKYIGYSKSKPRRSGSEIRDACPVHQGTDLNLAINIETGSWFCHSHGCKGGDLISLYQQAMNVDFNTAVQQLSELSGVGVSAKGLLIRSSKSFQERSSPENDKTKSRKIAEKLWEKGSEGGGHSYFERKGIEPPSEVRYGKDERGNHAVIVPYRDADGQLQAVQFINDDGKYWGKGTSPNGAFFSFGSIAHATAVYVAEGIATAASIWLSENKAITTLSCASWHNISKVVSALKMKSPSLNIVVCLDLGKGGDGAASAVAVLNLPGISFRRPNFEGVAGDGDRTDFNDLHRLAGLEIVRKQLQQVAGNIRMEKKNLEIKFINEISSDYFEVEPPEKSVLLHYTDKNGKREPFLHKEITAMLVAEGGRGKTHLCAMLAACVATGIPFLEKFEVKQSGAVCLIVGENNPSDIQRLLWKIRHHIAVRIEANRKKKESEKFCMNEDPLSQLDRLLCPVSVHGIAASLVDEAGKAGDFFNNLLKQLKEKEPAEGWQLIILDPASRFAGAGAEKDNAIATAFIACLEQISDGLRGKPTVLLSHHKNKAALKESSGQSDARGASGLTDGVRWQANLSKHPKDDFVTIFELPKTNFTPPLQKFLIRKNYKGIPEFEKCMESEA